MFPLTQSVFAGGMVSLSVGPDAFPIDAHIELLCASSPFFDKALDGRFVEAETKHIPLPDEHPKIFTEYLSWLYQGRFTFEAGPTNWMDLCQLWVLGDKFQVAELQNHVITLLAKKYTSMPSASKGNVHHMVISYVYDNTLDDSSLRRAITDICVWGMDIEKLSKHRASYPKEFLEDYAIQQARKARGILSPQIPLLTVPDTYFVHLLKKFPKEDADGEASGGEKVVESKEVGGAVVHDNEESKVLNQTPMPHRPKKIARGVRAVSRTASPRSPSVGVGASSPSPAPGTPTPASTASPGSSSTL